MNKMLLPSTSADPRVSPVDLLSQLGSARATSGDSAPPTGFAQLLQARVSSMGPSAMPAPTGAPAPRAGGSPEPSRPPSHGEPAAPEHPRSSTSEGTRSTDGSRPAARRSAEGQAQGKAAQAKPARPSTDADDGDPVLAQVLRHLRAGDGDAGDDAVGDAVGEDADDETRAAADRSMAADTAWALPSQAQGQRAMAQASGDAVTMAAADKQDMAGSALLGDAGKERRSPLAGASEGAAGISSAFAKPGDSSRMPAGALPAAKTADADGLQGLAMAEAVATDRGQAAVEGMGGDRPAAAATFASALQQAQLGTAQGKAAVEHGSARYELHAPLHSSGFAPEMAARLSLAAAEGVQQAQLHLNPAEIGPVQVQIMLDGQQAQISFMAEQADTRAVLEKSLPELAGALREQGLTLSGGGVFSQQQQAQSGSSSHANPQDGRPGARGVTAPLGPGDAADAAAVPARSISPTGRSRGVLDLFA